MQCMHPTYWNLGREETHQLSVAVIFMQYEWLRGLPIGHFHPLDDLTSTERLGFYHE
jgi:hypothetical protein